jgi:hypothetical protein
VNESPAQQPGFSLPIYAWGSTGGLRTSMSVRGAHPGHGATSDLSPRCAVKRTSTQSRACPVAPVSRQTRSKRRYETRAYWGLAHSGGPFSFVGRIEKRLVFRWFDTLFDPPKKRWTSSRVVLTPRRWRQVGGRNSVGDGGKKARSPRARRKPLKPSACGNAG